MSVIDNLQKKSKYIGLFVAVFLPLVLNLFLFFNVSRLLGNNFFSFIDSAILLNKNEKIVNLFSLWNQNNVGYIYSLFMPIMFFSRLISLILLKLNFSIKAVELLIYGGMSLMIYYVSFFIFYKIQKALFYSANFYISAVAAFLYSFGLPMILQTGTIDSTFNIILIAPIILYLLLKQLTKLDEKSEYKAILMQGILVAFILTSPPFSLAFLITIYLPFIFFKFNLLTIDYLKKYLTMFAIVALGASFFIYPFTYAYINIFRNNFYTTSNTGSGFIFLTNGMAGIFQFVYDWTVSLFYSPSEPHQFYNYFFSFAGIISSFSIWFLSILAIVYNWKDIKNKKIFLYIITCILLSIFLIKGNQSPFGDVNLLLYKINPILNIFRTPSSKFSMPIMLYLSVLILFALTINKRFKVLNLIIGICILLQTFIFFNPYRYIGYQTSKSDKIVIKIPQDYKDVINLLNNSNKEGSVLFYPGNYSSNYDIYGSKFISQDILGKFINRSVIYSDDTTMKLTKKILNKISSDFNPELVGETATRYVLIRKDSDQKYLPVDFTWVEQTLTNDSYKQIYKSPLLELFQLKDDYYKNLVSVDNNGVYEGVNYKINAPYEYTINTKLGNIINKNIILRNSYHEDWLIKGLDSYGLTANHYKYKDYENGWTISKKPFVKLDLNKNVKIELYYQPQFYLYLFGLISLFTIIFTVIFILKK